MSVMQLLWLIKCVAIVILVVLLYILRLTMHKTVNSKTNIEKLKSITVFVLVLLFILYIISQLRLM